MEIRGIGYADNQLPLLLQCCHVNVSVYNRCIPRCRASAAASLGRQAESISVSYTHLTLPTNREV